jgi:translation initiation factor IF-2
MSKESTNSRPPIVTIMGHVDHGKTSILDYIRKTNLTAKEYGGITQHIGAYQIEHKNQKITFIDTPGHAAFSQMRARGGKAADIVVLVVAADEGVKPQTIEAISHIKASGAPLIVAINKMDSAAADPQRVKQELASANILVEDWGGEIVSVPVSAKTGNGIPDLLDAIQVVAELQNLQGDANGELEASIIEAQLDRKKGVTVSCIVRNGSLKVGDEIIASGIDAKVKSLTDDKGGQIKVAVPGTPVEILGFSKVPNVGDLVLTKGSELAELAEDMNKVEIVGKNAKKTIAVIIKADTQGTLEAVKSSLAKLVSTSVGASFALKFIQTSTGDVTESDVMLAQSVQGLIIAFNVRVSPQVEEHAKSIKVFLKIYKTIYELIDEAEEILEGTATDAESKIKGRAQIQKIFKLPSGDLIAGSKVIAGVLKENSRISVYAKDPADITAADTPLYSGNIKKLKRGKDEVKLVGKDVECGILFKPEFNEVKEGLWVEVR